MVTSPMRSVGADEPVEGGVRHALEDEDDDVSPFKVDVGPRFANFKSSPIHRDSSSRLRGRGGSSCDSGSGSTSSFDFAGLEFALEPRSGLQTGRLRDPKVGPIFNPSV